MAHPHSAKNTDILVVIVGLLLISGVPVVVLVVNVGVQPNHPKPLAIARVFYFFNIPKNPLFSRQYLSLF